MHDWMVGPVLSVLGVLILAVASLAWRTVLKIEKKLEQILESETACRKDLLENYVRWDILNSRVIDPINLDRKERWHDYDKHKHDPASGVLVKT